MDKSLFNMPLAEEVAQVPCIDHGYTAKNAAVWMDGKTVRIHRAVFCKSRNVSLEDIRHFTVHRACGNRRCIEPSHLFLYPPSMANPFEMRSKKPESKDLWNERKKADPQKYLYWEYRSYPEKEYVK